jgi:type II secretory pathway pseudopilin PulG
MVSIAIFTALAVQYSLPKQQQQQQQDRLHSAQITAGQILQAALNYYIDNGDWPQDVGTLVNDDRLEIANTNPWGNPWRFEPIPAVAEQGIRLVTQAGSSQTAMALAARYGGIARVCTQDIPLCNATEAGGTWVHIGIAPP